MHCMKLLSLRWQVHAGSTKLCVCSWQTAAFGAMPVAGFVGPKLVLLLTVRYTYELRR